ncbi:hypothetical protein N7539_000212 [Penicillium diatomitis]|uniref:HPP transmembrane region domain-containing protein n=1 Tax=Penicillium diatomitis TaxID=2819901 RepID=A0A9W9XL93_9EURO|nr:uncharacterized protein N7539_000212 [Penicillium diatomitis]KAJ5495096.1 hypothetical protein N7539_000212 [Penicillium diatomitis]
MSQSRLARLPPWISHWLGYRAKPPGPLPMWKTNAWSFISAFAGLTVLQVIFNYSHYFTSRHVPGIIASYGASAVLVFGAIDSPLAQPRSLIFGHFLSALTGLCITKLFSLMPDQERFDSLRWLAASLSTSTAIVVMQLTSTTHPPAGATALLPATSMEIWALSWYYLPIVLLSSTLMMFCALLFNNNMHRRYPSFWFTPSPPPTTPKGTDEKAAPSPPSTPDGPVPSGAPERMDSRLFEDKASGDAV